VKKISLIIVTVIAAIAAISVVSVVSAQEQTATPEPSTAGAAAVGPAGNGALLGQLLQIVAADLNLQPQDIRQQLRGQSLANLIEANHGDVAKITSDITAAITDRIHQAVANGTLTQERADQILGGLDAMIESVLQGNGPMTQLRNRFGLNPRQNGLPGQPGNGFGFGGRQTLPGGRFGQGQGQGNRGGAMHDFRQQYRGTNIGVLLRTVRTATNLNARQLAAEMRGGKTLSDVITAHGGDPAAIENVAIQTVTLQLDQRRQNGVLTQEQETAILNGLKAAYDAALNGSFPMPMGGAEPDNPASPPI
jgi:hypothetical protein